MKRMFDENEIKQIANKAIEKSGGRFERGICWPDNVARKDSW